MYAEREESERLGESWKSRVEREEREAAAMKAGEKEVRERERTNDKALLGASQQ